MIKSSVCKQQPGVNNPPSFCATSPVAKNAVIPAHPSAILADAPIPAYLAAFRSSSSARINSEKGSMPAVRQLVVDCGLATGDYIGNAIKQEVGESIARDSPSQNRSFPD